MILLQKARAVAVVILCQCGEIILGSHASPRNRLGILGTLAEFARLPLEDRFSQLRQRKQLRTVAESAIALAHEEGLPAEVRIEADDIAYALADILFRIVSKPGNCRWTAETKVEQVWANYCGDEEAEKPFRLPGLAWSVTFENNADWRCTNSHLSTVTANLAWEAASRWFTTDEQKAASNDVWARYWSPTASGRFRAIVHPRDFVRTCSRFLLKRRKAKDSDAGDSVCDLGRPTSSLRHVCERELVAQLDEFTFRPGELGQLLRQESFDGLLDDVLLTVCQSMAERSPYRAVYFWLYHAVGVRQIEMTKKFDPTSNIRVHFRKFLNATEASVSKQLRVGKTEFKVRVLSAIKKRLDAHIVDGELPAAVAALYRRLLALEETDGRLTVAGGDA